MSEPGGHYSYEIRQSQRDKHQMILFIEVSKLVKLIEAESRRVVAWGWREEGMDSCCSMGVKFQYCKMIKF